MPDKFNIKLLYNYRHLIYMSMAILTFSMSAALTEVHGISFLMCRLWLDGCIVAVVAFLDILGRYRGFRDTAIHFQS